MDLVLGFDASQLEQLDLALVLGNRRARGFSYRIAGVSGVTLGPRGIGEASVSRLLSLLTEALLRC
jgi:hypothetical protein